MNEQEIEELLTKATEALKDNQPTLFDFTTATSQSEWNLSRHLSNEIQKLFPDYDCDVDLIKPGEHRKRPDIVIHRRGTHEHNLLVVEVKRAESGLESDEEKIRTHWFGNVLNYRFGSTILLTDEFEFKIAVIVNPAATPHLQPHVVDNGEPTLSRRASSAL
jgi:hypothetical protein